jgi:hypothetical protein
MSQQFQQPALVAVRTGAPTLILHPPVVDDGHPEERGAEAETSDDRLEFGAVAIIGVYSVLERAVVTAPRGGGTAPPPQGSADERDYGSETVVLSPLVDTVNVPMAVSAE